jgi:Flp pilus assembly pilin Flp
MPENRRRGHATKTKEKHVLKLFAFVQAAAAEATETIRSDEQGQTMAEYGVVLAVIVLAVIAAITLLSGRVSGAISAVANLLP